MNEREQWRALPIRTRWQIHRAIGRGQAMSDPRLAALAVKPAERRSRMAGQRVLYAALGIMWALALIAAIIFGHGFWNALCGAMFAVNVGLNGWLYWRWPDRMAQISPSLNSARSRWRFEVLFATPDARP